MRCHLRLVLAAALALSAAVVSRAQLNRGQIRGTVSDAQGAVIPNAHVSVTNVATNVVNRLTTNNAGFYLASDLVPGTYAVQVQAAGFNKLDISNIEVQAGTTATVDGSMKIGQAAETIDVTAQTPLIEGTASNFSTSIQPQLLDKVPILGRDIQNLVQLLPGITQSVGPTGSGFGFDSQYGGFPDPTHIVGSGISVNGSQGGANAWYLDGTLNATLGPEAVVVNPSPDAVSEFNLVDNGLAAEWSRTSGAVVNVVLKSGTNAFHGNLYEYNRNSHFNASNPFDRRSPTGEEFLSPRINFNDLGGTLGGPIVKNRTFFFFSWETSLLHVNKNQIYTVPTAQEIGGNFNDRPDLGTCPTCMIYDPYSTTGPDANGQFHRTPFPGNVIPANRIDPLAAYYVQSYPHPNFVDPLQQGNGCGIFCNNFLGTIGSGLTTNNMSIKVDHRFNDTSALFVEYLYNPSYYSNFRLPWFGPTAPTQGLSGAEPYTTANQILTIGHTQTFSSTFINEFRASYSRQNQISQPNPSKLVDNSGIEQRIQGLNFISNTLFPVPIIGIGGYGGFGPAQWQNGIQGVDAYTLQDNVTKIIGSHTVKAGLMWRRDDNWYDTNWGFYLNFGGNLTNDPVTGLGGNGMAQFLLGAVNTGSGSGEFQYPYQTNDYWGFYVQDDWRVNSKLTLNVGLRYDIYGWFRERHNYLANIDFNAMNPDVPYKGRIAYFGTPAHPASDAFPANKGDLGPRINFAWSPTDDRKWVIRGGYDIIYSNGISAAFGDQNGAISGAGFSNQVVFNGDFTGQRPAFQLSNGAPNLNLPPLNQVKVNDEQFLGTGPQGFLKGDKDPYVQQYSLFVERELPKGMALSVGYVGTHGLHLFGDEFRSYDHVPTAALQQLRTSINDQVPTPPSLVSTFGPTMSLGQSLKPYPQYANLSINSNPDGFNRYNSLQVKFEKRYSSGLNFMLAYTHQKNIGTPNTGSIIGNTATATTIGRTVGRAGLVAGALSGGSGNTAGAASPQNPDDRYNDVALTADDIPNVLNIAGTYELPFGKGKPFLSNSRIGRVLLGGWAITQNWNFQDGVPLVISAPCDGIQGEIGVCRPNLIGDPNKGAGTQKQWLNPNAFEAAFQTNPAVLTAADPTIYNEWWQFGNMGVRNNAVRSPGFWNADMSLSRDFHWTETRYFSFRWEVYNALNHQNLGIPNTSWCLGPNPDGSTDLVHQFGCQFGLITNVATDPRAMQFGLKFQF
ncbi:MAG TPA: TonB-dependent receptor [Bryobacteraceae bacterium]|nr:TonB-dependent receptor [Bryobacteraceae bacterium]